MSRVHLFGGQVYRVNMALGPSGLGRPRVVFGRRRAQHAESDIPFTSLEQIRTAGND